MLVQEKVGKGHPDKICDFIAKIVKERLIKWDKNARTAIEVCAYKKDLPFLHSKILVFGEYSLSCNIKNINKEIQKHILKKLKSHLSEMYFNYLNVKVKVNLSSQSKEVQKLSTIGAGDQGIIAHHYDNKIEEFFHKTNIVKQKLDNSVFIGKDWKFLVDGKKKSIIVNVHLPPYLKKPKELEEKISTLFNPEFKNYSRKIQIYSIGSILSDSGLTGRKIFCDFPFGYTWGGGAIWGKDPSKVDNSAFLYAREFAKEIALIKKYSHVQIILVYNIGENLPTNFEIIVNFKKEIDSTPFKYLFSLNNLRKVLLNENYKIIISKQIKTIISNKYDSFN